MNTLESKDISPRHIHHIDDRKDEETNISPKIKIKNKRTLRNDLRKRNQRKRINNILS